jgi:hypothetical protein
MPNEMRPEPEVIFEGQTSDWSEHAPLLSNSEANALADDLAIEQARALGFTEEELALLGGSEDVCPPRRASEIKK